MTKNKDLYFFYESRTVHVEINCSTSRTLESCRQMNSFDGTIVITIRESLKPK